MYKKHEYDWLVDAFKLNQQLSLGCDNPKEVSDKLKKHLYDLKDLMNSIDYLVDELE